MHVSDYVSHSTHVSSTSATIDSSFTFHTHAPPAAYNHASHWYLNDYYNDCARLNIAPAYYLSAVATSLDDVNMDARRMLTTRRNIDLAIEHDEKRRPSHWSWSSFHGHAGH